MKIVAYTKYGTPDVLKLEECEIPVPGATEVLVKVHATTVTPVDCSFRAGDQLIVRLFTGLLRPNKPVLGTELAGEIVSVGADVTRFTVGQRIFAAPADGRGAHAQYICLSMDGAQITLPSNMDYAEAATLCNGGLTALPFLRDSGKIAPGQRVLINGASGSIGVAAVQLAKHFGTHVTAVCSGKNMDMVRGLGADDVIDYTREDFTKTGTVYDIIFDTVGKSSFSGCKPALARRGRYLSTVPTCETMFQMLFTIKGRGKKAILSATGLRPAAEQIKDMEFLKGLVEEGTFKTVIDRQFSLQQIADAHHYVETGHKRGNVVITMTDVQN